MKLKEGFVTRNMGDSHIMVATGAAKFSGMVRSNATAAFIIDCLKQETTEDEIVAAMVREYDAPQAVIEESVRKVLDQLRSIGAIDE